MKRWPDLFRQAGFVSPLGHLMTLIGAAIAGAWLFWQLASALTTLWGVSPAYALGFVWWIVTMLAYNRRQQVLGRWARCEP